MRRLVTHDPLRGVDVYVDIGADGDFVFTQMQRRTGRLGRFVDETEAVATRDRTRRRGSQEHMRSVAEIPAVIVNRLMAEGIWGDWKKMRAWLNDPDHRAFRTDTRRL